MTANFNPKRKTFDQFRESKYAANGQEPVGCRATWHRSVRIARLRSQRARGALTALAMLASLILSLSGASAQGTFNRTIRFEGPPVVAPGTGIVVASYFEDGIAFAATNPAGSFIRWGGGTVGFPENGTAFLIFSFGDSLAGARSPSGRFGLVSVDLSEFSVLYAFPKTVSFIGYRSDGETVTTDFTTDGIFDGTGPLSDFQTFYFDERFRDLVRFEVPEYEYALDNLVVFDVIPEPGIGALLVLGAALLWLGKRFKRAKDADEPPAPR